VGCIMLFGEPCPVRCVALVGGGRVLGQCEHAQLARSTARLLPVCHERVEGEGEPVPQLCALAAHAQVEARLP
jgi:hypothetical protein